MKIETSSPSCLQRQMTSVIRLNLEWPEYLSITVYYSQHKVMIFIVLYERRGERI